jgi:enoyl-CoA hydratase/carnithine racemase
MRSDRGYMCMNEVDLPSPLAPGMAGILKHKMSAKTFRDMVLQGHRFTAQEALDQELVDIICPGDQVLDKAKELALKWAPKAKSGVVYKQLKDEVKNLYILYLKKYADTNDQYLIRCILILLDF